ncbi:MAG: T9SS type A sorting domain-containing protein [Candidatus Cloacimonetes bacterium]|nr:T9SS type A sorting domain-containing protein [Candidatus Cloacimonadota bacterium]
MRKTALSLVLQMVLTWSLFADAHVSWAITFGGSESEGGRDLIPALDDGYIVAGYTYSEGNGKSDALLMKTDVFGEEIWSSAFGTSGWEYANCVCTSADGSGYVLCGYTSSTDNGLRDVYLVKADIEGNMVWTRTWGGSGLDEGRSILALEDGYLVCGYITTADGLEDDILLMKTNTYGDSLWAVMIGCAASDTGEEIRATSDGNFIIAATTGLYDTPGINSGRNREMYLVKVDSDGNVLDSNNFCGISVTQGGYDDCYSICETGSGGFCAIGGCSAEGTEVLDVNLLHTDSELNLLWKNNLELENFYDFSRRIHLVSDEDGFLICGSYTHTTPVTDDLFLLKTDFQGNELWSCTYGEDGSELAYALLETDHDSYIVTGQTNSGTDGDYDLLLLEISELTADFQGIPRTGIAPFNVEFHDLSSSGATSWSWDLDGDGFIDAEIQDPSFLYTQSGEYDVSLEVSNGFSEDTIFRENYISVFDQDSALEFLQQESHVCFPADGEFELGAEFTIETWFNPLNWEGFFNEIINKGSVRVYLSEDFPIFNPYCVVVQLQHTDGTISRSFTPANSVIQEGWQHLALSYDGTQLKVYLYGVEQNLEYNPAPSGEITGNANDDLLLGNSVSFNASMQGQLDEIRIWNRIRTVDEINSDYLYYLNGNETGLTAYLQLNEGNGDQPEDTCGNLTTGTTNEVSWVQGMILVASEANDETIPASRELKLWNYPNPFNPVTEIIFQLPKTCKVKLQIYNLKGQLLETIIHSQLEKGEHNIRWDGSDYGSGIYLCRIKTTDNCITNRMVMLK